MARMKKRGVSTVMILGRCEKPPIGGGEGEFEGDALMSAASISAIIMCSKARDMRGLNGTLAGKKQKLEKPDISEFP
jgi:hypothetical protein